LLPEFLQHYSDFAIQLAGSIQIFGPICARHGMVWVVRRNFHLRSVRTRRRIELAMRLLKVDLRIKWLMRLQVGPIVRIKRLSGILEIPIGLRSSLETAFVRQIANVRCE